MNDVVAILQNKLPAYKGNDKLRKRRQDTFDIERWVMNLHERAEPLYDSVAADHWAGDEMKTAKHLFDFCRQYLPYKTEKAMEQTVKWPQAILAERLTFGNDCKHYASYIVGVGAALNRMGYPVKCFYRFGCYRDKKGKLSSHPGHVFAVFVINGREVWIDPVPEIGGFDSRALSPERVKDRMPRMKQHSTIGSLYEISGLKNTSLVAGMEFPFFPHHRQHKTMQAHHMNMHHHPGSNPRMFSPAMHRHLAQHQQPRQMAPAMMPPVMPTMGGAWLDEYYGHDNYIGKAKKKHKGLHLKVKLPHIKIQPGQLLKKVGMAPSRNAYLLLMKLNTFSMATNMYKKAGHDQAAWNKIADHWKKLGGNPNKLHTAMTQGVKTYNDLHSKHKISGYDMYDEGMTAGYIEGEGIGVVQVAGAAAIAAAAPIIAALSGLLKSLGIASPDKSATDKAHHKAVKDHNDATEDPTDGNANINADGSVDHGDGVTTKVTTDSDGKQVMTTDVKDPIGNSGGDTDSGSDDSGSDNTPAAKDGGGDDVDTDTGEKKKGFAGMMASVGTFVTDHKTAFIIGGVTLVAIIIIPRLFNHKKGRR